MRASIAALSFCLTVLAAPSAVVRAAAPLATDNATVSPSSARAAPVKTLDELRTALVSAGEWIDIDRWGAVWSAHDVFFRPYSRGRWTVDGTVWTYHGANAWDELTAHYGHWIDDALYGWVWKPDGRWRPAAVAWRMGVGHVGWAPLDPDGDPPQQAVDWVFVKGVDAVGENLDVVKLPPIASVDLMRKTQPLTTPPTGMAVLGLPEPGHPPLAADHWAATERTKM